MYIHNAIHAQLGDIQYKPDLVRQVDGIVRAALGRLRVITLRPRYKHWGLALKALLSPDMSRVGGGDALDLVVCDGFGDGFHHERHADERRRAGAGPSSGGGGGGKKVPGVRGGEDVGMADVVQAINDLRTQMGSVVVLSIQGLRVRPPFPPCAHS